jgi:hypothetical protein
MPADVRGILGKREFKRALRGASQGEVKALHLAAMAEFEAQIAAARAQVRGEVRELTHNEIHALCGEWYREEMGEHEADPSSPDGWALVTEALQDRLPDYEGDEAPPPFKPSARDLEEARRWLLKRGISVSTASLERFADRHTFELVAN